MAQLSTWVVRSSNGEREWRAEDVDHAIEQHRDAFGGDDSERVLGVWKKRWTRESCTLLYDGKPAIDVTRVVDNNSRATLTPVEVDAIRAHICDVLNTVDVDALKHEWMKKP